MTGPQAYDRAAGSIMSSQILLILNHSCAHLKTLKAHRYNIMSCDHNNNCNIFCILNTAEYYTTIHSNILDYSIQVGKSIMLTHGSPVP